MFVKIGLLYAKTIISHNQNTTLKILNYERIYTMGKFPIH